MALPTGGSRAGLVLSRRWSTKRALGDDQSRLGGNTIEAGAGGLLPARAHPGAARRGDLTAGPRLAALRRSAGGCGGG